MGKLARKRELQGGVKRKSRNTFSSSSSEGMSSDSEIEVPTPLLPIKPEACLVDLNLLKQHEIAASCSDCGLSTLAKPAT